MDALRALQLLTDAAYIALGIAAVAAALRAHERARVDVALLFGTLALAIVFQETSRISCGLSTGCVNLPFSTPISTILVLVLPYALLRLVDDVADIPHWQMWLSLVALIALGGLFAVAGDSPPGWLIGVLTLYIIVGTAYAGFAFARRARSAVGITRRRMAAVAWGCCLIAAAVVLTAVAQLFPSNEPLLTPLVRIGGLVSGLCFWAGFFPPNWLSQTWRLPELLGYLRPTRLMAAPIGRTGGLVTDAIAIERLCAATAATTGAQRVFLILDDPVREDLYLWGAPLERISRDSGLIGRVLRGGGPLVVRDVPPEQLPPAIVSVFATEILPRTAMLVPVRLDGAKVGVLAAFAEKGPMFVEDDLEVVAFFAGEAAAILQLQRYRESVNELEALRAADRLKDEFMAVVSHELRTPLTAITGYSDIMLRKLSGPLNERQERQVLGIRDAARRLLALINDLLDVSKLEAGTLDLHLAALDPASVIDRAVASVRVIAVTKGVTVSHACAPGLPPVRADDERLQQILSNLLINAIKFTPQGGNVTIGATCEAGPVAQEIVFRVEDTGVGLTPGQAARVWDRFYQAESSSTRRFGGAGLGLSIVRRLAELHGGRVDASSAGVDRGSTFAVYLPTALASSVDARETPPVAAAPRPRRAAAATSEPRRDVGLERPLVLVVEDDDHIATVLQTYLEDDGYRVQIARDGHEAIVAARELRPFAITLDISLPKLDGWSVLNALKREPATTEIPVIVVSIVDNRDFGLVLGATEYLVKPIDHERLRTLLHALDGVLPRGEGSVLVVDDDPAIRDVLSNVLIDDGWRVATAADGKAALEAIEHERPTAMVLDLMMPHLDGFEVLQTVRAQPATRDLPVVVVTAKELTDEDRQRLARSAERVLLKQALRVEDLREEVRALLAAYRQRTQPSADAAGGEDG